MYLWLAKTPTGPSVRFHVSNVHTMEELKFTGNFLKGSRPIISFDKNFDNEPYLRLIKELLSQIFSTPNKHPNSKPFIDHVISFFLCDGRIWFRCYEIADEHDPELNKTKRVLIETGPRFVLNPIKILSGSFGGSVLYENANYVSPNTIRSMMKNRGSMDYEQRIINEKEKLKRKEENAPVPDVLDDVFTEGDLENI